MNLSKMVNGLKKLKGFLLHRAVLITVLSVLTFILPSLLDAFIRKQFELSFEHRQLTTIGFSFFVIFLNILIVKKWLSFKQVGLQRSGFIKSLVYSLIFISLLRVLGFFGYQETFKTITWDKQFLLYLLPYLSLAFQEELMFRGVIFKVWERWKGFLIALFISSTLFGLEHLIYPLLGFEQVTTSRAVMTALFAPAFVLIAYRTKNLWGLTISHFLYNVGILMTDTITANAEIKTSFGFLAVGVSIFLPLFIDYFDNKISKIKFEKIRWSTYLATLFIIFFLLISAMALLEDLGITKSNKQFCPYLENEKVKACVVENIGK